MNYIDPLKWRYAVKKFDTKKKISNKQIENILYAINLSPSSYGLQPYNIILIEDKKLIKNKLQQFSSNPQLSEASHLILFAIKTNLNNEYIDKYINIIHKERNILKKNLINYKKSLIKFINSLNKTEKYIWQTQQVYIALGTLLYYCALSKIDTCPIGGFIKEEFDNILKLKNKNLTSIVLAAIGYRSNEDNYQFCKKIRFPLSEILIKY